MTLNRPTIKRKIPARAQLRLTHWLRVRLCTQLEPSLPKEITKSRSTPQPLNTTDRQNSARSVARPRSTYQTWSRQKLRMSLRASNPDNTAASPREKIKTMIKSLHVLEEAGRTDWTDAHAQMWKAQIVLSHTKEAPALLPHA